jgi:4-amino-4-deoxy-L-arabinose transferase-like glycosyltransferase
VISHENNSCLKTKKLILLIGTFFLICSIVIIKGDYNNMVDFTGDEWDYQSIAVNNYFGYDFLTTGRIKEIEAYKFENLDSGKIQFWERFSGQMAYNRSPLYPFFVASIYKLCGINPAIVKYIQLLLIAASGLLLVFIGRLAWGEKGFYIGYVSFIFFVFLNYRFSEHLMPENWQFLFLALITICLFYHYKGSRTYSIILGILLGISCLNKGTTFFLFPLIFFADLFYCRFKNKVRWQNMGLFAIGFLVITGLWSFDVSKQRNQFTFISSQTSEVILDGNNEYCKDGLWHPEWKGNLNSFYNTDKMTNKPKILRVINFYIENPGSLSNFPGKIKKAYAPVFSFIALITFYLILLSLRLYLESDVNYKGFYKLIIKTITVLLFCFSICFGLFSKAVPEVVFFSLLLLIFFFSLAFYKGVLKKVDLPFEFFIIFLNFLIFTLTFYVCNETYPSRYVKTMDGIFILVSVYLFFEIIRNSSKFILEYRKIKN